MRIETLASGSGGNAYKVSSPGLRPLLLDCGVPFKKLQEFLKFKTSELLGCLVTHEHKDHREAVPGLLRAGVECFMSRGTAHKLKLTRFDVTIIKDGQQFRIGKWIIVPLETIHDAAEPLSFRVDDGEHDLFYLTDSAYTGYRVDGVTHLLVECNYIDDVLQKNLGSKVVHESREKRLIESHMSLATVKRLLRDNDIGSLKEIHLCHLSDTNSDKDRMIKEIQELTGLPVYVCRDQ